MKQFAAFVKKEFFHILRDRRTMLILLGIPIVMIVLFGFAISTEVKNVRTAIYTPEQGILIRQLSDRLEASPYFTITELLTSPEQTDELFKQNKIDIALIFENKFEENLRHTGDAALQMIVDGTDPNTANMIIGYTTNILATFQQEMIPPDMQLPYRIQPTIKMLYNPQMKSSYNFVPGVMGMILMLICAMMTSISIVREKERGTMEVLLVSPVKPLYIILAKAVPYLTLSAVNLLTILVLSMTLLDVPVLGSLFWLSIVSLLFIFVALALGLLISSIVKTQVAAMLASGLVLMMPVVLLSGMIFPIENMPNILQWFSAILPARWYISAVRKIMIEGLPVFYVLKELSILCLMALLLIAISLKNFKQRLE